MMWDLKKDIGYFDECEGEMKKHAIRDKKADRKEHTSN